jgi:ubiquinone/menaquinone biosynthesis C-methylase UbiE
MAAGLLRNQGRNQDNLNPERLHQITFSFISSRVLTTGIELGVFTHIAGGKNTAEAVARAAKADARGMRMLLDALAALELVTKKNSRFTLTPLARKFLVRGEPDYLGSIIELPDHAEAWRHLTKSVRTGRPVNTVEKEKGAAKFFPALVSGLHVIHRERARRAAEVLGIGTSHKGLHVVDVGCGSGVWGIAAAAADRTARITAQDYVAMLPGTRKYVKRDGVEGQFDYLPGDLNKIDFGKNRFDLAILGNIVHSEGERNSRRLFRRLYRALRPGGRIAIADMIPNDTRTGPPFPVFFALNMLLNTERGDTYTLAEYADWLMKAGMDRVETADIGSHSPLIIGYKK